MAGQQYGNQVEMFTRQGEYGTDAGLELSQEKKIWEIMTKSYL